MVLVWHYNNRNITRSFLLSRFRPSDVPIDTVINRNITRPFPLSRLWSSDVLIDTVITFPFRSYYKAYQLKKMINVRISKTLDVNRFHKAAVSGFLSRSSSSNNFSGSVTLLTLAALRNISSASCRRPLLSSHLGDSGKMLKKIIILKQCTHVNQLN